MKAQFIKRRQQLSKMRDELALMTRASYVDNYVEIGDFFSQCVKIERKCDMNPHV